MMTQKRMIHGVKMKKNELQSYTQNVAKCRKDS